MVRRLRVTSALALLLPIAGCSLLVDSAGLNDPGAGAPAPNPWIDASVASDGATADAGVGELDATTLGGPVDGEADGGAGDGGAGDGSAGTAARGTAACARLGRATLERRMQERSRAGSTRDLRSTQEPTREIRTRLS